MSDATEIAARLRAAGIEVEPLVWRRVRKGEWEATGADGSEWVAYNKRERKMCSKEYVASVLDALRIKGHCEPATAIKLPR